MGMVRLFSVLRCGWPADKGARGRSCLEPRDVSAERSSRDGRCSTWSDKDVVPDHMTGAR